MLYTQALTPRVFNEALAHYLLLAKAKALYFGLTRIVVCHFLTYTITKLTIKIYHVQ